MTAPRTTTPIIAPRALIAAEEKTVEAELEARVADGEGAAEVDIDDIGALRLGRARF